MIDLDRPYKNVCKETKEFIFSVVLDPYAGLDPVFFTSGYDCYTPVAQQG